MIIERLNKNEIIETVRAALAEDLGGYGDITSSYLISDSKMSHCNIVCKERGGAILSGLDIAACVFEETDKNIRIENLSRDGASLKFAEKICSIEGHAKAILAAERTALNFLQHMSGISTLTSEFVKVASRYGIKITDTRKTKPLLRKLEKYAVRCGRGYNHRFGLFDGIMIKDNHIEAAGSVSEALTKIRNRVPHTLKIEVEVKDFKQLSEALEKRADIIMLDNMDHIQMKEAVDIIRKQRGSSCIIEASGNISLDNLEEKCKTGIDIVSVGAITHSAPAIDFSLEFR